MASVHSHSAGTPQHCGPVDAEHLALGRPVLRSGVLRPRWSRMSPVRIHALRPCVAVVGWRVISVSSVAIHPETGPESRDSSRRPVQL
jgi:hypothetical protein